MPFACNFGRDSDTWRDVCMPVIKLAWKLSYLCGVFLLTRIVAKTSIQFVGLKD